MSIHTSIERITPELASAYLQANTDNRAMRSAHVAKIASDIENDRWIVNGASIVFNGDGTLLDGQHRLAAIVKAGRPVEVLVVRGVSKGAMPTIDSNVSRNASDVLGLHGFKHTTRVVSAARMILALRDGELGHRKVSNSEILDFVRAHPHLQDAAAAVEVTKDVIIPSISTTWYYLAAYAADHKDLADVALSVMATGIPSYKGDSIHVYRERILKMNPNLKATRAMRNVLLWTLFAAWNDFMDREKLTICKLRQSPVAMADLDLTAV